MWTLDQGLTIVRALQEGARKFNYHLCLGGSVLNKGESEKDLDLYFISMAGRHSQTTDPDGLVEWLTSMWDSPHNIDNYPDEPAPAPAGRWPAQPQQPLWNAAPAQIRFFDGLVGGNAGEIRAVPIPPAQAEFWQAQPQHAGAIEAALEDLGARMAEAVPAKAVSPNPYTRKMIFYRGEDRDRIDVFVLG